MEEGLKHISATGPAAKTQRPETDAATAGDPGAAAFPDPDMMTGVDLAYIGDAVFELMVREQAMTGGSLRPEDLHKRVTGLVNAAAQSELVRRIDPLLTEEERSIVRRGRNGKLHSTAKNQTMSDYRRATGLEALVGWLYLKGGIDRLRELIGPELQENK